MKKFFLVSPEVAGHLHENTILDPSTRPIIISQLHYVFDDWLGDDLLGSMSYFIVTENLAKAISVSSLSGVKVETCKVSLSEEFLEKYPAKKLPPFKWLKIVGKAEVDDFGLTDDNYKDLVLSEFVLKILKQFNIANCDVEEL